MDRTSRRIATVVVLGLTAIAIAIPVAQGGIRPDDRAVRGVSVVAVKGTADLNTPATRPDDRAVHGVSVVAVKGTADLHTSAIRPTTAQSAAWLLLMVRTSVEQMSSRRRRELHSPPNKDRMDGGRTRREHHAYPPLRVRRGGPTDCTSRKPALR